MRLCFLVAVLVTAALLAVPWAARGGAAPSAPSEYADLYAMLEAKQVRFVTRGVPQACGADGPLTR